MRRSIAVGLLGLAFFALLSFAAQNAQTSSVTQETKTTQPEQKPGSLPATSPTPTPDRGVGIQTPTPQPTSVQSPSSSAKTAARPEIVLQAGITLPQTQISFSPDGRLLASMGIMGNSIKLWEVASGRLLRQLESSIPSMGTSSKTRPFRFSGDGKTLIAFDDGRIRRWEVETGKELDHTLLPSAKNFFIALLSEDGRTLAALNFDSSAVRLWDTTTAQELRAVTFDEKERLDTQEAIALSPDGRLLAAVTSAYSASRKGIEDKEEVSIWETSSGKRVKKLLISSTKMIGPMSGDLFPVSVVAFSRDGSWLAVRSRSSMKIWDVATGTETKSFETPRALTTQDDPNFGTFSNKFTFSPDKRVLSLVSDVSKIKLVETGTANTLHTLPGHDGNIVDVSFSGDGKLLATSGIDNQIKLWDVGSGTELRTFKGASVPINDLAFTRDGKSLALAGQGAISYWELTTGGVRRAVVFQNDYLRSIPNPWNRGSILSANGRWAMAGSNNQAVAKLWDLTTGREVRSIPLTNGKVLGNAAFSADGRTVALMEGDKEKPRPDPSAASTPTPTGMPDTASMPDFSKVMEQMRKNPKKIEAEMKKAQEALAKGDLGAGMQMMESLGMMPKKANANPNSLRILETDSGRQLSVVPQSSNFMTQMASGSLMSSSNLAFSPDGRVLAATMGYSSPIQLTEVTTGQHLHSLKTPYSMGVNSLAWSSDGKRLASAAWGMKKAFTPTDTAPDFTFEDMTFSIRLWDAQSGTEVSTFVGHNNFVMRMAFSPDGRLLASGGFDNTIKIWDVNTGRELRSFVGHAGSITALDFTPDGKFIVSGSDDGSARLWSTETGALRATLVSLNQGNDWLVVTPDGLFDGSPGGWNQILWRFTPTTFDVSPVEIFFSEYFYPGLLPDILMGKKLSAAGDISHLDRRQPKIAFATAEVRAGSVSTREVNLKIQISEAPAGARDLRLFRNGSLVKVWRGDVLGGQSNVSVETTVSITAGENQFTAYAFNRDNVKSTDATLLVTGAADLKRAATLHLLAVGVNRYANAGYDLKYAVADGQAFATEVERQQKKLGQYAEIKVTTLFDQQATKANIMYAVGRLTGSLKAALPAGAPPELERITPAQPEDAVVVYYAGHGTAQDQRFYLIPHDLGYQGKRTELDQAGLQEILSHSISDLELEQAVEGIDAGLVLMVVDACNSGQALEAEEKRRGPMNSKGLAQLAYEKGMYILTAAQSYQAALEAAQLGHGYLTFALVEEGLKTVKADAEPTDGQVLLREWLNYATERVPRMQEEKMHAARGLKIEVAFVEGEEKLPDLNQRSVQRPRVFYRREQEKQPLIVARP